jgi:EAL domain-containing protein (putative c-di-GMP-specific phosphodiesterase class I)
MASTLHPEDESGWPYLDHFPQPGGSLARVFLNRFPFRLGRNRAAHLVVLHPQVSKTHAEIVREGDQLFLQEMGSTNGTFLNGQRITGRAPLHDGDILHLAEKEFRFGRDPEARLGGPGPVVAHTSTMIAKAGQPRSVLKEYEHLHELIAGRQATAHFQPIVSLTDWGPVGFEALGRGRHGSLPTNPGPLFALADQCQLAVPLSRLFRQVAVAESGPLPRPHTLFVNLHPKEQGDEGFLADLQRLSEMTTEGQTVAVEVNEGSVADVAALRRLRDQVHGVGFRLAYDDFGVGQGRLAALAEVPADYVKLDRSIVQNLPHSRPLRDLVRALGQVCADVGTELLAEGVETEDEMLIAQELGCHLGQGYLFARPLSACDLVARHQKSGR